MSQSDKQKSKRKPEWKPQVEFFTSLSANGRFIICKTVITAIKPVQYFEKVMQGATFKATSTEAQPEHRETESEGS
jgi:hypothetical protein